METMVELRQVEQKLPAKSIWCSGYVYVLSFTAWRFLDSFVWWTVPCEGGLQGKMMDSRARPSEAAFLLKQLHHQYVEKHWKLCRAEAKRIALQKKRKLGVVVHTCSPSIGGG